MSSSSIEVTMPQMGVSVAEGTVVAWRAEVGETVRAEQTVCEISTDKIDSEVPAPADGVLAEVLVSVGETVPVGTVLARIGAAVAAGVAAPSAQPRLTPVVRRIVAEHHLDLTGVTGSGRGGRIRKQDVLALLDRPGRNGSGNGNGAGAPEPPLHIESPYRPDGPTPAPSAAPVPTPAPSATPMPPGPLAGGLSHVRRQIGEHMKRSLQTAATCTSWIEVDMGRVERERAERRLTALAYVARATIEALRAHPSLNATLDGDAYARHDAVHLGIAVSLGDAGLIVPVIRDAHELSAEGLGARVRDLARPGTSRRALAGRGPRRDVHDHQPRSVRHDHGHPDHQPAAGRDPRSRGRRQAAGRGHRRRGIRRDRDPADVDPRAELGSPRARRRRGRPVSGHGQGSPPGIGGCHVSAGEYAQQMLPELWVCHLGTLDYAEALALQEEVRAARQAGAVPDVLLTLQHWPVLTRGRRSADGELPMGADWYGMQGIEVVETDRGGKVTYHGPGQLVGYPIVAVDDVVAYVRLLERALVRALAEEGVEGRARFDDGPDFTGVWVQQRKIASIGVHVQRGVTTHGFAVNVENDLQPFSWIVPCGLDGVQMTSLIKETGRLAGQLPCFRKRAAYAVAQELGRRQRLVSLERLRTAVASHVATATL